MSRIVGRCVTLLALLGAGVLGGCAYDPYTGTYYPCCSYYPYHPYYPTYPAYPGYPTYPYPPVGYPPPGNSLPPPGAIPRPQGQAAPVGRATGRLAQRFDAANVTHDGRLTLDQAQAAGWRLVERNFAAIDHGDKGFVTLDDIRAWGLAHRQQRSGAAG